jgi:hypothetical protein
LPHKILKREVKEDKAQRGKKLQEGQIIEKYEKLGGVNKRTTGRYRQRKRM